MDNIILERDDEPVVMKLEGDEEALMKEFEISAPKTAPRRPAMPKRHVQRPPVQQPVDESIDAFTNPTKMSAPARPPPEVVDYGDNDQGGYGFEDDDDYGLMDMGADAVAEETPSPGYNSIDDEKADLLNKLTRLEKKGFSINKKLTMYSNIDDLRTEVSRITYGIEVDQSVRFSRRMLIACVTGLEFMNKRYNPLDLQLEGWSESVMENVEDYDPVFEELYAKYRTKMHVAPEIKLIMMLGGSATMFHLTNSMFRALPNANDVLKQNPGLVQNMMDAVKNTTASSAQIGGNRPATPTDSSGRREMKGPGIDLASLMGGISMPPPPPMSSTVAQSETTVQPPPPMADDDEDDMSDIVSVAGESTGGEVREVSIKKGRKSRSKKKEVSL